ncbi:MAG: glycosyltransferase family 4 protein [Candidatus Celaenobacter antarcticus]|nr:glycosyltransferase family 4 protein [Candidatus Celaenobacter antarcticus]
MKEIFDKPKIKILHIQLLPLLSGVQNVMIDIMENASPDQFEFSVISAPHGPLIMKLKNMDLKHYPLPGLIREINLYDIIIFFKIYKVCRSGGFDIVHTHSSKTGFLGRIAARIAGIPVVIHTIHGFPFNPFQSKVKQNLYKTLERIAGYFCDMTVSVNRSERELAIKDHIIPSEKIMTIYNGIDIVNSRTCIHREELGFDKKDIIIGSICRFSEQKNIINMIKTAIEIVEKNNKIKFVFLGDGELWSEAEKLVQEKNLTSKILLPGWTTNVRNWLLLFDIYVLYSRWEGLSLSILEAMSVGLPIIASDIKGNNELVQNGYNGFLIKIDDKTLLAQKILSLSTHYKIRNEMGKKSLVLVKNIFSLKLFLDSYNNLYNNLYRVKS